MPSEIIVVFNNMEPPFLGKSDGDSVARESDVYSISSVTLFSPSPSSSYHTRQAPSLPV